jgi:hypothetical protein
MQERVGRTGRSEPISCFCFFAQTRPRGDDDDAAGGGSPRPPASADRIHAAPHGGPARAHITASRLTPHCHALMVGLPADLQATIPTIGLKAAGGGGGGTVVAARGVE